MIDQRARHGHALLLAAGKLRGKMLDAIGETHANERRTSLGFVCGAVKILREHHVFERGEIRHEMKLLEDESDFLGAETREPAFIEARDVGAIHDALARTWACRGRREY